MQQLNEMISLDDVNRCSRLIGIIADVANGIQKEMLIGQTTAYAMGMKAGFQLKGAGGEHGKRQDIR